MREDRRQRQDRIQSSAYKYLPLLLFTYFSNKARILPLISGKRSRYHRSNHIPPLTQKELCLDSVVTSDHSMVAVEGCHGLLLWAFCGSRMGILVPLWALIPRDCIPLAPCLAPFPRNALADLPLLKYEFLYYGFSPSSHKNSSLSL